VVSINIDTFDEITSVTEAVERLRAQIGASEVFVQFAIGDKLRLPHLGGGHLNLQKKALSAQTHYFLRRFENADDQRSYVDSIVNDIQMLLPQEIPDPKGISILVGANGADDGPYTQKLQQLMDGMWTDIAPTNTPGPQLDFWSFKSLRGIDSPVDRHGFLLLMATVPERAQFHYTEDSKALVRRMGLKAAGVALFSPEGPIRLPEFVIIRCEPELDTDSLREFIERVAASYRASREPQAAGRAN
jgi:hypothetical protein